MDEPRRGQFRIVDDWLLVAAVAFGISGGQAAVARYRTIFRQNSFFTPPWAATLAEAVLYASPMVYLLTAAVAIIALIAYRKAGPSVKIKRGPATCAAVIAVSIAYELILFARKMAYDVSYEFDEIRDTVVGVLVAGIMDFTTLGGYVVIACWCFAGFLGLDKESHGDRILNDRLGSLLCVLWVILLISPRFSPAY